MTRSEKDREECISRPLLDATFPSEPNRYPLDRLRQQCSENVKCKIDMEVLVLSLFPPQKKNGRYVTGRLQ